MRMSYDRALPQWVVRSGIAVSFHVRSLGHGGRLNFWGAQVCTPSAGLMRIERGPASQAFLSLSFGIAEHACPSVWDSCRFAVGWAPGAAVLALSYFLGGWHSGLGMIADRRGRLVCGASVGGGFEPLHGSAERERNAACGLAVAGPRPIAYQRSALKLRTA